MFVLIIYRLSSHFNCRTCIAKLMNCIVVRQVIELCSVAPFLDAKLCQGIDLRSLLLVCQLFSEVYVEFIFLVAKARRVRKSKPYSTEIRLNTFLENSKISLFE